MNALHEIRQKIGQYFKFRKGWEPHIQCLWKILVQFWSSGYTIHSTLDDLPIRLLAIKTVGTNFRNAVAFNSPPHQINRNICLVPMVADIWKLTVLVKLHRAPASNIRPTRVHFARVNIDLIAPIINIIPRITNNPHLRLPASSTRAIICVWWVPGCKAIIRSVSTSRKNVAILFHPLMNVQARKQDMVSWGGAFELLSKYTSAFFLKKIPYVETFFRAPRCTGEHYLDSNLDVNLLG